MHGEESSKYEVLVGKPEGYKLLGKTARGWDNNNKMYLK
jgi:hypothetical protein